MTGADDIIPTNHGFSIRKENNMSNYKTSTEVINAYAHGELTLEECNRRLKELGTPSFSCGFQKCRVHPFFSST